MMMEAVTAYYHLTNPLSTPRVDSRHFQSLPIYAVHLCSHRQGGGEPEDGFRRCARGRISSARGFSGGSAGIDQDPGARPSAPPSAPRAVLG